MQRWHTAVALACSATGSWAVPAHRGGTDHQTRARTPLSWEPCELGQGQGRLLLRSRGVFLLLSTHSLEEYNFSHQPKAPVHSTAFVSPGERLAWVKAEVWMGNTAPSAEYLMGQNFLLGFNAQCKKGHDYFLKKAEAKAQRDEQVPAWLKVVPGLPSHVLCDSSFP